VNDRRHTAVIGFFYRQRSLIIEGSMLRVYRQDSGRLVPTELDVTAHSAPTEAAGAVWIDLINPARHEDPTSSIC
jgi:hypothetical protein